MRSSAQAEDSQQASSQRRPSPVVIQRAGSTTGSEQVRTSNDRQPIVTPRSKSPYAILPSQQPLETRPKQAGSYQQQPLESSLPGTVGML